MKSSLTEIAQRYVNALFSLASEANAVAVIDKDLHALASASAEPEFAGFLANPLLSRGQQEIITGAIAEKISAHALTRQFLKTLAGAGRLAIISEVAKQFAVHAQAARGEVSAEVVSAVKLDSAQAAQVTEQLGRALGKKVTVTFSEDPSLLGGMVVKMGSQQLDASLAGKLNRLSIALKAA